MKDNLSKKPPLVSIIVRTLNEEKWIGACLKGIFEQTYENFEVIIVDNVSVDQTVSKASIYPVRIVSISSFTPGRAINIGIEASSGEYIVCLSGHCIPTSNLWLEKLVSELKDDSIGGVYGRQQPLSFSSAIDKRDLLLVFGLDRKLQTKDSFFHNANSAFRRDIWEKYPFDEEVSNIEDRLWGRAIINAGFNILYEPDASVFHWHGIHHNLDPLRAQKIVQIIEGIDGFEPLSPSTDPSHLDVVCIIPMRGPSRKVGNISLLERTIKSANDSLYIKRTVVSSDCDETIQLAKNLGVLAPFKRPSSLSEDYIDNAEVLRYSLAEIETLYGVPDLVVYMDETYPFRNAELVDHMIEQLLEQGLDTIVAVKKEFRGIWLSSSKQVTEVTQALTPNHYQESFGLIGLLGLGMVTRPMPVRDGTLLQQSMGFYFVNDPISTLQFSTDSTSEILEALITKLELIK